MMNMEALKKRRVWCEFKGELNKETLIIFIIGLLLSRTNIMNGLTPFGFAYLSAYMIIKGENLPVFISVTIGSILFHGFSETSYVLSYVLSYGFFIFNRREDNSLIKSILITSLIFIASRTIGLMFTNERFFIYDAFILCFEGLVVFSMTYIFSFSPPIENIRNIDSNSEKRICSFIVLALALGGINNIEILGISLKNISSIIAILYLGYIKGAFFGGTVGIILGMVVYMGQPTMPFTIAIFSVSGLMAGMFRDLGKIGSILGFILGNAIVTFYINGLGSTLFKYKEIGISIFILMIIPKNFDKMIINALKVDFATKKDYIQRKEELILKKLQRMADVFKNLSITFKEASEEREINSTVEVYSLVDGVANKICKDCDKYKECWEQNYYSRYNSFFRLVSLSEIKDSDENCLKNEIEEFCIRPKDIVEKTNHEMEKLKLNERWKSRLNENRILLSEQLSGFGNTINYMISNIYENPIFNEELEDKLYKELKNNRVDVDDVDIVQINNDDLEVFINLNTPYEFENKLRKIVSLVLGFPVIKDPVFKSPIGDSHRFKLIRNNRFSAITKSVSSSNSEDKISGDSFTFGDIENIHYTALSDGMGIGRKAKEESSVAISLLEKLMEANMDKELILNTINSVLRTKSNGEMFTTLDFGFIDLYSGKFQAIKAGSPLTLIKKKDRIDVINSETLPVGILKDVELNIYEDYVEDGDIIIMVSDGITEANKDILSSEDWLKNLVMNIDSINPSVIANEILKQASNICEGDRDDMTVLVTKIWKNI